MTEKVQYQVQSPEIGFSRRLHGMTLRDTVSRCDIRKRKTFLVTTRSGEISATMVRPRDENA